MTTTRQYLRWLEELCKSSAKAIPAVAAGQTRAEVRAIMGRDPWRYEPTEDAAVERWGYPTDFEKERVTWIIFDNGLVREIGETSWRVIAPPPPPAVSPPGNAQ